MQEEELLDEQRTTSWWALCFVHNVVVHPWLPIADVLQAFGWQRVPQFVYWVHDNTAPKGGG